MTLSSQVWFKHVILNITRNKTMIPMINPIDEISRVTPLGLRFWDALALTPVGDGLIVTVYPTGEFARRTEAISNPSGIYVAQNLPGLREIEFGRGDAAFWASVVKKSFVVEVIDGRKRFQPFTFLVDLPFRDLFTEPCPAVTLPLQSSSYPGVPLYSAPTRSVSPGIGVIYAHLWDALNDKPASWAMLEASLNGQFLARGFADREGRIALLFPYPEPNYSILSPPHSSPISGQLPLADQTWTIQLQSFYTPQQPIPEIADLCKILNQSPAQLQSSKSPAHPLTEAVLHYGQALILRSVSQSIVWIVP